MKLDVVVLTIKKLMLSKKMPNGKSYIAVYNKKERCKTLINILYQKNIIF